MLQSSASNKGQIVLPKFYRKKYGVKKGTLIRFFDTEDGILMIPITPESVERDIGVLKTKKSLLKALAAEKRNEREL